jgi:hypothetical protein
LPEAAEGGVKVGYIKPVGAMPKEIDGRMWDEDAYFVQKILGTSEPPDMLTPVLVTHDFRINAFSAASAPPEFIDKIRAAYEFVSKDKDVTIVAGSGGMYSGKYCNTDGIRVVKELGLRALVIDRYSKELNYDYMLVLRETWATTGRVIITTSANFMRDQTLIALLERRGIKSWAPSQGPLGGPSRFRSASAWRNHASTTRPTASWKAFSSAPAGRNFMTLSQAQESAIIARRRSASKLVALEGDSPCLVLTGNLYPNDIILTRSEVLEIPIIVVREDTYSVAKKMEALLMRHKLRDEIKIRQGAQLVSANIDFEYLKKDLGLA